MRALDRHVDHVRAGTVLVHMVEELVQPIIGEGLALE